MDQSPREILARLLEESAPAVLNAWLAHRSALCAEYFARFESFLRNRFRFASRWQADRLLFVPLADMSPAAMLEMRSQVAQLLQTESPGPQTIGPVLARYVRNDTSDALPAICEAALSTWAEEWFRQILDSHWLQPFPDEDARQSIVRSHWIMFRGAVQRWACKSANDLMKQWDVATVLSIACGLSENRILHLKTLRIIYGWDLRQAVDVLDRHS